jgi:hypothetical protein
MRIITWKEATALNLPRFYPGTPCKNGHVSEYYTKSRWCVMCKKVAGGQGRNGKLGKRSQSGFGGLIGIVQINDLNDKERKAWEHQYKQADAFDPVSAWMKKSVDMFPET